MLAITRRVSSIEDEDDWCWTDQGERAVTLFSYHFNRSMTYLSALRKADEDTVRAAIMATCQP